MYISVYIYIGRDASHEISSERHFAKRERIYRNSRRSGEKGCEVRMKDLWFPRGVLARRRSYRGTAVHYFLMSNKAISMCPDQGPQVLTRVISPRSPACATSSSERRTLLSSPFSATFRPVTPSCRTMARSRDYSAPSETRDARYRERVRSTRRRWPLYIRARERIERRKIKEGERSGDKRRSCPPSEGASKGNFTKADPLVMNVI